jgi:hypothetical protein
MKKYRTKRRTIPGALTYDAAIDCMRQPDTRLVRMHGRRGCYYLTSGGRVDDQAAIQIIAHPLVRGGEDGLLADCHQTWRLDDAEQLEIESIR